MKQPIIATGVFGAGLGLGQVTSIPGTSAASVVAVATTTQTTPDQGGFHGGAQDTPHADGTVTAINGDTLTLSAGTDPAGSTEYAGVTTVVLTGATTYDAGHDSTATASKSSIKVGSYVIVDGTVSSDGKSITATSLGINAGGPVPGR